MLDIDKLKHDYEKPFLKLLKGIKKKRDPNDKDCIIWYKGDLDNWYFYQINNYNCIDSNYDNIWLPLKEIYGLSFIELDKFIEKVMRKKYDIKGIRLLWPTLSKRKFKS